MRCHGTVGSSQPWRTVPANRGAPGETSPYVRTNPDGVARTRRRTSSARSPRAALVPVAPRSGVVVIRLEYLVLVRIGLAAAWTGAVGAAVAVVVAGSWSGVVRVDGVVTGAWSGVVRIDGVVAGARSGVVVLDLIVVAGAWSGV